MLAAHPQICLAANKESHLFDQAEVQRHGPTAEDIEHSWPDRQPGQLLLDATPSYLYLPGCLEALVRHAPDVRIIVILRPPGERAVSQHGHERRLGSERRSFPLALALEHRRLRRSKDPLAPESAQRHASYRDRGRYADQIRLLATVTDRYRIVTLADLIKDPTHVVCNLYEFLGLAPHSVPALSRLNSGDGRRRPFATTTARLIMRREAVAAERLLCLPTRTLR